MENVQVTEKNIFEDTQLCIKRNGHGFVTLCNSLLYCMLNEPHCTKKTTYFTEAVSYMENVVLLKYDIPQVGRMTRQDEIFENFINTVKLNYKESRAISFYADKLCLSPKYLSATVKKVSEKKPSYWIDKFVIKEIKMLLKSTNQTVQEISDKMNFSNQSFFGRYFKQHVGLSPRAWIYNVALDN